jgi:tetratricopeptide (TPR) repeat protein
MAEGEKVPFEWFLDGNYKQALAAYQAFVKTNPNDPVINEGSLDEKGYYLLSENKTAEAKEMFWINMMLYPTSASVYDGYAEACMKNGDTEEAITYYKKTLAMQPDNPTAAENLKALTKK